MHYTIWSRLTEKSLRNRNQVMTEFASMKASIVGESFGSCMYITNQKFQ